MSNKKEVKVKVKDVINNLYIRSQAAILYNKVVNNG